MILIPPEGLLSKIWGGEKVSLILASASPRRRELLSLITSDFTVIPAQGKEKADTSLPPEKLVQELAKQKAAEVAASHPNDIVIGADTLVFLGNKIMGKPASVADAKRMLTLLSGKTHTVITAVAIAQNGVVTKVFAEKTKVKFFPLTDEEITAYIATGEPMDKAGAYGIQNLGAMLVQGIAGDYYNVMGLPVGRLYRELKSLL